MKEKEYNLKDKGIIFAESYNIHKENLEKDDEKFILTIDVLPLNKVSDNGFSYNEESIRNSLNEIVGLPFCDNHIIDGSIRQSPPFGHVTEAWIDEDRKMLCAKADIDPEEKMFIRKAKRGDIGKVSIQVMGDKVVEKENAEGNTYNEAYINRWLEISSVISPGFIDTSSKFEYILAENLKKQKLKRHEHLKNNNTEDVNTTTADGAVAPAKLSDDDKNKKNEEQKKNKEEEEKNMEKNEKDLKASVNASSPSEKDKKEFIKDKKPKDKKEIPDEEKPEENEGDEKPKNTVLKEEYEDDMTNVTDVLEKINQRLDDLEQKINGNNTEKIEDKEEETEEDKEEKPEEDKEEKPEEEPKEEEEEDEEPKPPKKENKESKISKKNAFLEYNQRKKNEALNKAVKEFLKK